MHEEVPEAPGTVCHGVQMFVNLRARDKAAAPRAFHLDTAEVPERTPSVGARVRVLAGHFDGASSPLTELLTPVLFLDVHLAPRARVTIPVEPTWNTFVLSLAGGGVTGPAGAERPIAAHEGHGFHADGDALRFAAGEAGLHLLVCGGEPLGEPIVAGGPFVGTSQAEVEAAYARYRRGDMGRLRASF